MQELIPGFQLFILDSVKKDLTLKIKVFLPTVSSIFFDENQMILDQDPCLKKNKKMVDHSGFEPKQSEPKSLVLPLHQWSIWVQKAESNR